MEFQNTNLKVLVGNAGTAAAETALGAFKTSASTGETIATDSDGSVVVAGTTKFILASKKADGTIDTSGILDLSNATVSAKAYAAAAVKSEAIGYNGTDGAFQEINDNLYQINIELLNFGSLSPENRYYKQAHYQSPTSGTDQSDVVDGLALSLVRNFSREPIQRMKIERLCSNAGVALGTGVDDVTFTKGSKFFTATDIDDATTNSAMAVGDYIRIGTATSSPVYKITALDTTNNIGTLDVPYQGATTTIADTGLELIPVASQAASDFGILLTGVDQPFAAGKLRFEPVDWRPITLVDCGTTGTEVLTVPTKGIGDGRRVAELEWFAQGNFAEMYRMGEPHLYDYASELVASTSGTYDVLTLEVKHKQVSGQNLVDSTSPFSVVVFCDDANSHANINSLITDLNKSSLFSISTL